MKLDKKIRQAVELLYPGELEGKVSAAVFGKKSAARTPVIIKIMAVLALLAIVGGGIAIGVLVGIK